MKKPVLHRMIAVLLLLAAVCSLTACGKKEKADPEGSEKDSGPQVYEVRINSSNFYDYFDYRQYPTYATDEDGNINAVTLSYGFSLRDGFHAANDPDHKDTLKVSFTAEGVAQYGEFTVDFQTLDYSGTAYSEERETISETLTFWPQGDRTVSYPYGTLSTTYIIAIRNMSVTQVTGSIWLRGTKP